MVDVEQILSEDRFYPDYNPELQLRIVKRVVNQLRNLQRDSDEAIAPYSCEPSDEFERMHYEDAFYDSCYTPVVVSQSIISQIASYLEGVFRHEVAFFCTIANGEVPIGDGSHHRCKLDKDMFWDVVTQSKKGKPADMPNIAVGIWQILKSLQISDCFNDDFHTLTKLIFEYRNFSMHNGFEWDQQKREKFKTALGKDHYADFENYFSWSQSGGDLWMVSIQKDFIDNLLDFCDDVSKSFENAQQVLINREIGKRE